MNVFDYGFAPAADATCGRYDTSTGWGVLWCFKAVSGGDKRVVPLVKAICYHFSPLHKII